MEIPGFEKLGNSFLPYDRGFSSTVYTNEQIVVKVYKGYHSAKEALQGLLNLESEHKFIRDYLGDYALQSDFIMGELNDRFPIAIIQAFIRGLEFRRALFEFRCGRKDTTQAIDFLERGLDFFHQTGFVPDLLPDIMPDPTLGRFFTGKFTYRSHSNAYVVGQTPVLVDSNFNRSIRHPLIGTLLNPLIAQRMRSILNSLN